MQKVSQEFSNKYNGFITKKGNYVWAGAMCLAWNQLKNSIIKQPIKLATSDKSLLSMIDNFNSQRFHHNDINPNCVYAKSGYGPATLQQINKQVKEKFPQKSFTPLNIQLQDDSIISYAYLIKRLQFLSKFQRLPGKNFLFNNQQQVDGFYADNKKQRKQIQFVNYENKDNFCIVLKSKNPKDLLFLVKSQNHLTLEEAIEQCNEEKLKQIGEKDNFMMPVIDLDLSHSIDELKLPVLNQKFKQYKIQEIFENIKLQVDEQGAKVQNEAVMVMNRYLAVFTQIKQFILDKPFWILMKQTGKHVYFAAFIKNPIDTEK